MDLIFASNNQHKLEEIQALAGENIRIKSLSDIGCNEDIPETGTTFSENAAQKSRFIYEHYRKSCFADDSGLEVDALNGEPGVYSARYSGTRDPEANLQLVLNEMEGEFNRKARFKTVICLILDGQEYFFEGTVEGEITLERAGVQGFGYDPIFRPEGYSQTFAEMTLKDKNGISHRSRALQNMLEFLKARG